MKKIVTLLIIILSIVFMNEKTASALAAKDYVPNTKKVYILETKGHYIGDFTEHSRLVFEKGYWHTYNYFNGDKKYEFDEGSKYRYKLKKDGIYLEGTFMDTGDIYKLSRKILPKNFKKGTIYKAPKKSIDYSIFTNKIISTNEKIKVGNKTYKNVVKVKVDIKDKSMINYIYYAKGVGSIKETYTNKLKGDMEANFKMKATKIYSK